MLKLLRPIAATTGTKKRVCYVFNVLRRAIDVHVSVSRSPRNSAVLVAVGAATKGRLWEWVPASYDKLEQAERRILESAIPTEFEMTKVAQLGTVVVPCSDAVQRGSGQSAPNLVMIHGFAGGNAVWAKNLADLSKHFNVVSTCCPRGTRVGRIGRL